jgi:hypothetical protein
MRSFQSSIAIASCTLMLSTGVAFAGKTPQVPTTGQPGVGTSSGPSSHPLHACANAPGTPGGAANATGSVFNTTANGGLGGTAGLNYAGNPNTASLANSNSAAAVSQYDIACFQAP